MNTSRLIAGAISVCGVVAVAGCGGSTTTSQATPGAGGVAIFNNQSANDLITSLVQANLPVPDPRNVTAQDCPAIGCTEKIDTATVSIMKFPTTGRAELYVGTTPRSFQVADVVMTFAPTVSPARARQYEQVVTREIQ